MILLKHILIINYYIFIIGLSGIIFTRKNIIIVIMSIELMLLSINMNFIAFSLYIDDISGLIFSLILLTIAASEAAIGLAIIIVFYRFEGIISINFIKTLKG